MKIGIGSYTFPWAVGVPKYALENPMTALDLLQKAIAMKVDKVQFADNMPLHELTSEQRMEIKTLADNAHIELEVGTRGLYAEHIKVYAKIAYELSSPFLRVVIDDVDYSPNKDEIVRTIYAVLPVLKRYNIVLAIENHDRFTARILADIIELTDMEYVGVCLDTANSLGAGEGIDEVLSVLNPYTVNLHVKDVCIERLSHKMGFAVLGCPAGVGIIDIPNIIKSLATNRRLQSVTLEVWSDFLGTTTETVVREEVWAQQGIAYLKNIKPDFTKILNI